MPGGSCERCNATKRGASQAAVAGKRSLHTAERERREPGRELRGPRREVLDVGFGFGQRDFAHGRAPDTLMT